MRKQLRIERQIAIAMVIGLLVVSFQNCTAVTSGYHSTANSISKAQLAGGNGEGYSGKGGELYRHFNPQTPCADKDRDGKPLPNEQIFFQSETPGGLKDPYVVRENCVDVSPQQISTNEIKLDDNGSLNFKNRSYSNYKATADFQVLAATCPAGKTLIPGALRTNLIVNSQDWTEQPIYQGWMWHAGIQALLNGSIMSLPAYTLVRHDPQYPEEFRRISQMKQLKSNTSYAFSFLAKKGTRDAINFRYYRVDQATGREEYINVDFNLVLGVATGRWHYNLPPASFTMTPVGDGYFCTVHFTTSATGGESHSDFGFSPASPNYPTTQLGDSVFATAAQLEATNGFCK